MTHKPDQKPNCSLCNSENTSDFFTLPPIPTMDGVMCKSKEGAIQAVRGQIILRFCNNCGYVGNEGHDPGKISFDDYDFSNAHSPIFAKHTKEISDRLINSYDLHGKNILDIGCGDGYFLKTICTSGNNKGIGIDPGFDFSNFKKNRTDLTFIRDYYSKKYAHFESDLLTCRHVLNVINDPIAFIKSIRENLNGQENTIVYFDAPNVHYTLGDMVIWNVVYEHRSWFSETSLKYLLEYCGFEVLNIAPCWNGEYLSIEARPIKEFIPPKKADESKVQVLASMTKSFNFEFEKIKATSQQKINQLKANQKRTIAWGAGARGVSFFNIFDLAEEVPFIVDINEKRQDKFLPGSGQKIVAPEFLTSYNPDLVIITNPTYADEIMAHARSLGVDPEFWVL